MTTLSYTVPVAGSTLNSVADPEVATALSSILTWSTNIDSTNVTAALAQSATVNQSGQVVKGVTDISTSQTTTSSSYTTLATPDQVTGIVLPTDGLIAVWYQATWSESNASTGLAAIFLGTNQLKYAANGQTAPIVQATGVNNSSTGSTTPLATFANGLTSQSSVTYSGDVTTGQAVFAGSGGGGGVCYIFAAAGTYTVSVKFKTSAGTLTVLNRKLWVEAKSFA